MLGNFMEEPMTNNKFNPWPLGKTEPAYSAEDLQIAKTLSHCIEPACEAGECEGCEKQIDIAIAIAKVRSEARLEEHRRECVIYKFVTNNPCEAPQTCERCAALSGKETA